MILYTPFPMEVIFDNRLPGQSSSQPTTFEMTKGDMRLILEPIDHTNARIVRMISPRPNDYLNPGYAPGSIISLKW